MRTITLEELLEAGCHFGHQVNRRNPKADEFIFEARSNIHIINLEKTHEGLMHASQFLKDLSAKGGYLVVVGTKKQAKAIVKEHVERARGKNAKGIFYVNSRWVGGTITNFQEVSKNFKKYKELMAFLDSKQRVDYTKREIVLFQREKNKLESFYGGIFEMDRVPDALYVIDTHNEITAVREAERMDVATVGIVDTNADPTIIDYPIPANDDAVGSISLITRYLVDAWIEGQQKIKDQKSKIKNEESREKNRKEKKVKET